MLPLAANFDRVPDIGNCVLSIMFRIKLLFTPPVFVNISSIILSKIVIHFVTLCKDATIDVFF